MVGETEGKRSARVKPYRGAFYAVWSENGLTQRRALRTKDRAVAERNLTHFIAEVSGPLETVGEIYNAWVEDKKIQGKPHKRQEECWRQSKSTFQNLKPQHINKETCRAYVKTRERGGVSRATIRKELEMVRAAVNWRDPNTKADFEIPAAESNPRDRYLSKAEYYKIRDAAEGHVKLFIILALATAARPSAILDLTWDRVDLRRKVIRLGKGEKRQKGRATVPMTQEAHKALLEANELARTDHVIEWADRPVASIKKAFQRLKKKVGMDDVTLYTFRHTSAVWMAEARNPMSEIAQYLGHTSTKITEKHYARFSPQHLKKASKALEV